MKSLGVWGSNQKTAQLWLSPLPAIVEDAIALALAAGFDHHLVKPVDTSALTSVLSAIGKQ